ncbi:MAG: ligase-associated DNA damage response DEXH box helicase [Nitrospira sp.]|nr:ligase-associated DNA damage response DEXH box helicase [Nitrospira sp.]
MKSSPKVLAGIRRLNRLRANPRRRLIAHRRAVWPVLSSDQAMAQWLAWFEKKGWVPFSFQREAWNAYFAGRSGVIAVATGSGKTYAALGAPLIDLIAHPSSNHNQLWILYISPLKALVRDVVRAVQQPLADLQWPIDIAERTGDTAQSSRRRLKVMLPHILVTTPESLAILLTDQGWQDRMKDLRAVVVDEWHELLGSKRGSLLELTLARLRSVATRARTWALSATIANLDEAAQVAVGSGEAAVIRADVTRRVLVQSILPESLTACPWFGYSGLRLLPDVLQSIDPNTSTLLFTNTRSHAERWYQAIVEARPEWKQTTALHHGSLDQEERQRVEGNVKNGNLRLVVSTSSLDLGVDFPPVEDVIQIGSAKSVARAIQRAGRAFHRPGEDTRVRLCPTNVMEILEASAVREAIQDSVLEERVPKHKPLDVLVQFLLNSAFHEGFTASELLMQVRSTYSFRAVTDDEFSWALQFVQSGGSLAAYPHFHKIEVESGRYHFASPILARQHKMNIGTIASDGGVIVQLRGGKRLGTIDEAFITKLNPGEVIQFAGRTLRFLQMRDMVAYVKAATHRHALATVWTGTIFPLSLPLSRYLRQNVEHLLYAFQGAAPRSPEIAAWLPIAQIQSARSRIPTARQTLAETCRTAEGHHLFVYTWDGWSVNEGLGHLVAYRLARLRPNTIAVSATNHGFELLSTEPLGSREEIRDALTDLRSLDADIQGSLNYPELAKRAFRDIARVAGLIQQGTPSVRKSARHLHMSSSLLFDVFTQYEPQHPLLMQAYDEVREQQLELHRLCSVMQAIANQELLYVPITRLTPFAFSLYAERIRSRLSTEKFEKRIARLQREVFG